MLDQSAVGLSVSQEFSYDWRDIVLYHLSVGAVQEELDYVYEDGMKVLPAFGVLPCLATFKTDPPSKQPLLPTRLITGIPREGTLHMDHKLIVHKPVAPCGGRLHIIKTIREVYDRGMDKGAKIMIEISHTMRKASLYSRISWVTITALPAGSEAKGRLPAT